MGQVWVRNAGAWVQVENGVDFRYHNGTSFVNPTEVLVRDAGAWSQVWVKSDPVTVTSNVNEARSFRRDGVSMVWRPSGQEIIGRFDTGDDGDSVLVYRIPCGRGRRPYSRQVLGG